MQDRITGCGEPRASFCCILAFIAKFYTSDAHICDQREDRPDLFTQILLSV